MLQRNSQLLASLAGVSLLVLFAFGSLSAAADGARPVAAVEPQDSTRNVAAEPPSTQPAPDDAAAQARARLVTGLVGSAHDFSENAALGRDLCLPCHTPHLESAPQPRLDRRPQTTLPLRPFESPEIELTSWSLLCLGCHDGVIASDVYSTSHAVALSGPLSGSRIGERGLRSHPIGIEYPLSAEGYRSRAAVEAAGLPLPDGRIQCTTCHNAHNTEGHAGMLQISNRRSKMCLTCHEL